MPIPDEKARAWTRPEDYWPPRRPARTRRSDPLPGRRPGAPHPAEPRPWLDIIPYAAVMVCLAILTIGIMIVAWPGNVAPAPKPERQQAEVGLAPKGWLQQR